VVGWASVCRQHALASVHLRTESLEDHLGKSVMLNKEWHYNYLCMNLGRPETTSADLFW
jgi:hypothetical protein